MKAQAKKFVLGLAITAVIGAGVIVANGLFVANALAIDNDQKAPIVTSDVPLVSTNANITTKYVTTVVTNDVGNQTIIWDEVLPDEGQASLEHPFPPKENPDSAIKFVAGTPSEEDLSETIAIKTAKNAVTEKFALTEETWARFSTSTKFNVADPDSPIWGITFYPTDQNDFPLIGTYHVIIDSRSADIIEIMSAADGVG
ncbi:hypothetical protein [Oscillibacter sp.]|uniref:hypothetical protein n=1 Tax=Oscillibacter sp. TaxID=1945593 RepID=UPI0028B0C5A6|nr:hypothetical protein [Oscillibacter sp.]